MGHGVLPGLAQIMRRGDNLVLDYNNCTNGRFAARSGFFRFLQRETHKIFVGSVHKKLLRVPIF
jgi:hypothetical protein